MPVDAGLRRPAAGLTGQRDRRGGRTVVAAVGRQDLVATRVQPGHSHRVLVGLGAAVGEEDLVRATPGACAADRRRRLAAGVVREHRRHHAQLVGLVLDRLDEPRVLVAQVQVDQLRGEVEVAVAVVVPEPCALAAGDRHRSDVCLGRPRVEHVGPISSGRGGVRRGQSWPQLPTTPTTFAHAARRGDHRTVTPGTTVGARRSHSLL